MDMRQRKENQVLGGVQVTGQTLRHAQDRRGGLPPINCQRELSGPPFDKLRAGNGPATYNYLFMSGAPFDKLRTGKGPDLRLLI